MLMRKPVPPPEAPPAPTEMPRDEAGVDAALADIETERSQLRATLAALPAEEQRLLDQDADDAAFFNLDLARRRGERRLEQLDRKEQQLVKLAERYQAEAQQAAYSEIRQRYAAASQALSEAAAVVKRRIAAINTISRECDQSGFSALSMPTLPPVGYSGIGQNLVFDRHLAVLGAQPEIAAATPKQVPRPAPRATTHAVRFLKWTEFGLTAYQRGQIASFKAADCRKLVARGRAEWMKRGMEFDPVTAAWGAGPAPSENSDPRPPDAETAE